MGKGQITRYATVTMTFIGLVLSMMILYADDRGIVVDDIVDETGVPAWEYAFITYLLSVVIGIIIEALSPTRYGANDVIAISLGLIACWLILDIVVKSTTGGVGTDVTSIQTEIQSWYEFIALIYAVAIGFTWLKR